VAALAGVSHQTVSRVLNGHPSVAPATRAKVDAAIAALQYRRNSAARALATGTSRVVGVLVSSTTLSGPANSLLAIEQTARDQGYWVSMASLRDQTPAEVAAVLSQFADQQVAGVIAIAQTQVALDAALATPSDLPLVLLTSGEVPPDRPAVDIDQRQGTTAVMDLLIRLGHRHIAHLAGPADDLHAQVRLATWQAELARAGGAPEVCLPGDWSAASGYRATRALLDRPDRPSAIFAANDRMALGALRALHEAGWTVPGDCSVVGFDDLEGSDCAVPPLTTVRQDHTSLGVAAMGLLAEALSGAPARQRRLTPALVVRASTGPAQVQPDRTETGGGRRRPAGRH